MEVVGFIWLSGDFETTFGCAVLVKNFDSIIDLGLLAAEAETYCSSSSGGKLPTDGFVASPFVEYHCLRKSSEFNLAVQSSGG